MTQTVEILPFITKEPGTNLSRYTDYLTELLRCFPQSSSHSNSPPIKPPFISPLILSLSSHTHKCTPNNATVDLPLLNIASPSIRQFIFVKVTVYQRLVDFKKAEVWVHAHRVQRTHKTTSNHSSRAVPGALRTVFYRSNTGIASSNPSRGRDECNFLCLCRLARIIVQEAPSHVY